MHTNLIIDVRFTFKWFSLFFKTKLFKKCQKKMIGKIIWEHPRKKLFLLKFDAFIGRFKVYRFSSLD